MCALLVEILLPVGAVIKVEASLPVARKFVTTLYNPCFESAKRGKHSTVSWEVEWTRCVPCKKTSSSVWESGLLCLLFLLGLCFRKCFCHFFFCFPLYFACRPTSRWWQCCWPLVKHSSSWLTGATSSCKLSCTISRQVCLHPAPPTLLLTEVSQCNVCWPA